MIVLKIKGSYLNTGIIELETAKIINWASFTNDLPPEIPFGIGVEVSVSFEENDFLTGKSGIVWATYDLRQAEIIQSALIAQHINCEIKPLILEKGNLLLMRITNEKEIKDAVDFIWKSNDGLRLKPDWAYADGKTNKSFEQWLTGH
ncbi:MAG: hypothetical protein IPJ23_14205 [Ignavibacteriales bacterium]|nr:hypothetical protein [Ignavibacteriales bacterium]